VFDGDFDLAVDTAAASFRLGASAIKLQVLGQELTGDFAVEQATNAQGQRVVRVGAARVGLSIAGGLVTVTNGTGLFVIAPGGIAGSLSAGVSLGVTGVSLSGAFALELNTTAQAVTESLAVGAGTVAIDLPAGPYLRVSGTGVALTIAGQTLRGDFSFERTTTAASPAGSARRWSSRTSRASRSPAASRSRSTRRRPTSTRPSSSAASRGA
jgi:hypothetical protein